MPTQKEMTKHIRTCIKRHGIKARVRMFQDSIQVFVPEYGIEFTEQEQREIRQIAKSNELTWVRGLEIVIEQMTNPHDFNFYM